MATFGKTTDGATSSSSTATKTAVSQAVPASSGTVVTGHAQLSVTGLVGEEQVGVRFAIYADNGGVPGALLALSDETPLTEATATWKTFTFSGAAQIAVTQGTPYWVGPVWDGSGEWSVAIWRDGTIGQEETPAGRWEHEDFTYPNPWDPFDAGGVDGNARPLSGPLAAYVTYSEGPPTVDGTASAELGFTAAATGVSAPALPRLVQTSGVVFSGLNALTLAAELPAPATAGNFLVFAVAGDKNLDPLTGPDGFDRTIYLRTGNVSLLVATKVADGGETEVSATLTAGDNQGGSDVWLGEFAQDGDEPWQIIGSATGTDNGANVTEKSTGTTGTLALPGLALAAWAVDSINTPGTASYSNGYTEVAAPSAGASTCAGLWLAELTIATPGGTTECTLTRSGDVTPDQMCAGVIVFGRGDLAVTGSGTANLGFTASAAGERTVNATASAGLGFTATATGVVLAPSSGRGTVDLGFTATAVGERTVIGSASADLGFTATATVERTITGTASAGLGFTATAAGEVVEGLGVPFLPELGPGARLAVEVAWGADPAGDPDLWTWHDITRDVRADPGISTRLGRDDEASESQPASLTLVLDNTSHAYSLGGHSPNWPNVRRNVPVRVRINATGVWRLVFIGYADGFTPGWDITGRIPVVTLSASGAMRRLLQGDAPVISAYRRAMTDNESVVAYWPFEDGRNASYAKAVRGGSDMVTVSNSHEFASDSPFDCSAPLVRLRSSPDGIFEDFGASVAEYTVTGETQIRWLMSFPRQSLPNGAFLCDVFLSGTLGRVSVTYADGGADPDVLPLDGLHLTTWDPDNDVISEDFNIAFPVLGATLRLSLELEQDGSNAIVRVGTVAPDADEALFFTRTLSNRTIGRVTSLFFGGNDVDDVLLGHVTVQNQVTDLFEASGPLSAHVGELPTPVEVGRLYRLTREAEVQFAAIGSGAVPSSDETMGPQLARPLMELLRECEEVDQGQLWDGAFAPGLVYSTRRFRELGTTHLTIDAAAGELAPPFEPVDDDQRTRNRVDATITTGVTARFEDVNGPLGTATIGIYDSSVEVNNEHDDMAVQYAAWHVSTGTVAGYRFPSVAVDLRAAPHLADEVLRTLPGYRIDVLHADQVLSGYLPGDVPVSLIVEGVSHEIGPRHWRTTFRCSPFSPWGIARVAEETGDTSEYAWRLDTDGTRLVGDHPAGSTTLTVSNDPLPIANDTFSRTETASWGSADLGGGWLLAGTDGVTAADFSVASGAGRMSAGASGRVLYTLLPDVDVQDVDVAVTCTCSAADISGGLIELGDLIVRAVDLNTYYYVRVTVSTSERIGISIVEVVDAEQTELIPQLLLPAEQTFTGSVRVRVQAEGRVIRAKVWRPGDAEPADWQREVTVTAARSGWIGTRVGLASSNSNTKPLVFSHDDFVATTINPPGGPLWTTDPDDYPLRLSVGGIPVVATACAGESPPQTFTVEPLPVDRTDGTPVALWDPRPIGL